MGVKIGILDAHIGNVVSVENALCTLGIETMRFEKPTEKREVSGWILPGVGAFGACRARLQDTGLDEMIQEIIQDMQPLLGICIGMQLLFDASEESPGIAGFGILPGEVRRLRPRERACPVPQMQWNETEVVRPSWLFPTLTERHWYYFVHSYAVTSHPDACLTARYGQPMVAAVVRDNVAGVQFHPEKSGPLGLSVLQRFAARCERRARRHIEGRHDEASC